MNERVAELLKAFLIAFAVSSNYCTFDSLFKF